MRRRLVSAVAVIGALAVLGGCGGSDAASDQPTNASAPITVITDPAAVAPVTTSVGNAPAMTAEEIASLEAELDSIDAILSGVETDLSRD